MAENTVITNTKIVLVVSTMPKHFYLMILFLRESERQKNVSNVPGKTGKRRGRPPKRKKVQEEIISR